MRATNIHLPPLSAHDLRVVAGCVLRVLADSNRTGDIVTAEEITAQAQLAHLRETGVFETDEGRTLLAERPNLGKLDLAELRGLSPETLGGAYARFFDTHALSQEILNLPTPYTEDEELAYILLRIRQVHDVWHTLVGLGTQGHEEILVHSFSLAQTGLPSSVALLVLGSLKHMVLEGRWDTLRHGLLRAHRIGTRAKPLLAIHWERRWEQPLAAVRRELHITPYYAAPPTP